MDLIRAIIIAIVEGLTEYLPVSSTAHMIFTSSFFGIQEDEFVKMFQVSIQFGAILAVVFLYWKKFFDFKNIKFYLKLAVAVLPALVLGKLFDDKIETVLEKPIPIAAVHDFGICFTAGQKAESAGKNQRLSFEKADDLPYFCLWPAIFYHERPQFVCGDLCQSVFGGVFRYGDRFLRRIF
jgi:undecaprenyl pyrophosphate phosphatase UppP